jgi:hypothetical protein
MVQRNDLYDDGVKSGIDGLMRQSGHQKKQQQQQQLQQTGKSAGIRTNRSLRPGNSIDRYDDNRAK